MPSVCPKPVNTLLWTACLVVLLPGCGNKASDATQVVANVNKTEISVHQVNHLLQRQPGLQPGQTEAAGRQALERLIEQEVAVQKALDLKLDRDPAVMQNIAEARRDILARAYGAKVAESATKPEAADLQAYFDARPALFAKRRVYALQEFAIQADKTQAEALAKFVTSAKNLPEVTDYLRDQRLAVRANQSTQPAENLPPALVERLNAMRDGQLLLLAAPGGARIIVLTASREAPVTLEQARASIEKALVAERRMQAVQSNLDAARKASEVKYFGAFATAAASAPATAGTAASAPTATPTATPPATPSDTPPATARAAAPSAPAASAIQASAEDAAMVTKGLAGLK